MAKVDSYMCPECGADVPVGSSGCVACGPIKVAKRMGKKTRARARKKRSWEQDERYDGVDLGGEDFDYEDFVAREFGGKPHRQVGLAWYWWLTGVVLLVAMGWMLLR